MACMWPLKQWLCNEYWPPIPRCCMLKHAFESSSLCLAWKRWAMKIKLRTSEGMWRWAMTTLMTTRFSDFAQVGFGLQDSQWALCFLAAEVLRFWCFEFMWLHVQLAQCSRGTHSRLLLVLASDASRAFRLEVVWSLRSLLSIARLKFLKGPNRIHQPAAIYSWNERHLPCHRKQPYVTTRGGCMLIAYKTWPQQFMAIKGSPTAKLLSVAEGTTLFCWTQNLSNGRPPSIASVALLAWHSPWCFEEKLWNCAGLFALNAFPPSNRQRSIRFANQTTRRTRNCKDSRAQGEDKAIWVLSLAQCFLTLKPHL